jgi:hypothetical protein
MQSSVPTGWSSVPAIISPTSLSRLAELRGELGRLLGHELDQGWVEGHLLEGALRGDLDTLAAEIHSRLEKR